MKKSALMAGGILLQNELTKAMSEVTGPLKIGLIGCGYRGKGLIKIMQTMPEKFKVVAISELMDYRMKETEEMLAGTNVKSYKDYHKLLADKKIDAVVVAVSLAAHFEVAKATLMANKHIYLEKTMTYNISQALELVAVKKQHPNQILQVGHQYRYTPLYGKVKEIIQNGYLGKITKIDCHWDRNSNWRLPVLEPGLEHQINWRMYKATSGGLTAELLSHQIDFINWAFGTHPDKIMASGGIDHYEDGRETFDNIQVQFRYNKDKMIANFGSTLSNARDGYLFKIKGTKGTISLLPTEGFFYPELKTVKKQGTVDGVTGATKIEWNNEEGSPIKVDGSKDGTWYCFNDFYNCIALKKEPASNVITGATTAFCVHLANEAMYNSGVETWKPEYTLT